MSEPQGFCEFVRQAKAGNPAARGDLLEQFRPCVEQVCRDTSVRGEADLGTSDLVQEVWVRVLEKLDQFKGAEDNQQTAAMFYTWVQRTARGVVLNLFEARAAQRRTPPGELVRLDAPRNDDSAARPCGITPAASDDTPSEIVMAVEEARQVSAAIDELADAQDREMIRSRFYRGESLKLIAERLGISYDTARERFQSALVQLEYQLSNLK